jgi:hypothetical protein
MPAGQEGRRFGDERGTLVAVRVAQERFERGGRRAVLLDEVLVQVPADELPQVRKARRDRGALRTRHRRASG